MCCARPFALALSQHAGVELKPSYFETACKNITAAEGQLSLLAPEEAA